MTRATKNPAISGGEDGGMGEAGRPDFTVFGAAGFIGRHLTAHLRRRGHAVETPGRHGVPGVPGGPEGAGRSLGHAVWCIGRTADFRTRPLDTIDAHVGALARLLRHARFDSFLYLSSTRVYGGADHGCESLPVPVDSANPDALYDISKLAGESLCLAQSRPEIRVARLSNVYGPGMRPDTFLAAILREAIAGHIRLGSDPRSMKDYIAVYDVVDALTRIALDGNDRLVNVASGRDVAAGSLVADLKRLTGCGLDLISDAPRRRFPPIDTGRLRSLYARRGDRWTPTPVEHALPGLLAGAGFDLPADTEAEAV